MLASFGYTAIAIALAGYDHASSDAVIRHIGSEC